MSDDRYEVGCLFPGECCMSGLLHFTSECHTAEMMEAYMAEAHHQTGREDSSMSGTKPMSVGCQKLGCRADEIEAYWRDRLAGAEKARDSYHASFLKTKDELDDLRALLGTDDPAALLRECRQTVELVLKHVYAADDGSPTITVFDMKDRLRALLDKLPKE